MPSSRKTLLNQGGKSLSNGAVGHGSNKHLSTTSADRVSFHKPQPYNELDYENEEEDDSSMDQEQEKQVNQKPKKTKATIINKLQGQSSKNESF